MANKKNQHFVPQFYFRYFTGKHPYINVLLKENGKIIHHASIKGQCSKDNFYGSKENEESITQLELSFKKIIDDLIAVDSTEDLISLYECEHFPQIYPAVLFQRKRTEYEINKAKSDTNAILNDYYKHLIETDDTAPAILKNNIDKINFTYQHEFYVGMELECIYPHCNLLTDLGVHILRNKTNVPFIFGDAPVVFYNQYYRKVVSRGVLGLTTPGLMIFYPLSPDTILLLIDDSIYNCPWRDWSVFDVTEEFDVKHLNKLQIHSANKSIYFPDCMSDKTITKYWKQEKNNLSSAKSGFSKRPMYVDGKLTPDVMMTMDHHISYFLKLSFIKSNVIEDDHYRFKRRNQEIYDWVQSLRSEDEKEFERQCFQEGISFL